MNALALKKVSYLKLLKYIHGVKTVNKLAIVSFLSAV